MSNAREIAQDRVLVISESYNAVKIRPLSIYNFIIPDPCDVNLHPEIASNAIQLHPTAYASRPLGQSERQPMFGDVLKCNFVIDGPNNRGKLRGIRYSYPLQKHSFNYKCADRLSSLSVMKSFFQENNKNLLPPKLGCDDTTHEKYYDHDGSDRSGGVGVKYVYQGSCKDYQGETLYNGSLPGILLGKAKNGKGLKNGPKTVMLREILPNYDRLVAAYEKRFKTSFIADSYRDYKNQIRVRRNGINAGTCKDLKQAFGVWTNKDGEERTCLSARPGTSQHGWGLGFDIKNSQFSLGKGSGRAAAFASEEYKWMKENAPKYGFWNPDWASEKQTKKSKREPWHWEWIDMKSIFPNKKK